MTEFIEDGLSRTIGFFVSVVKPQFDRLCLRWLSHPLEWF